MSENYTGYKLKILIHLSVCVKPFNSKVVHNFLTVTMDFLNDINVDGLIQDMKVDVKDLIELIRNQLDDMDTNILDDIDDGSSLGSPVSIGDIKDELIDNMKEEVGGDGNKDLLSHFLKDEVKSEEGEPRRHWLTDHGQLLDDILKDEYADCNETASLGGNNFSDNWVADMTVPEGWMIRRMGKNKIHVRSPVGRIFQCRRQALEFLRKNKFPQNEIDVMNEKLVFEGWYPNENLPLGWKFRMDSNRSPNFLTPTDIMLSSGATAAKYIENNSFYTKQDLQRFIFCVAQLTKMKALMSYQWKTDRSLPEGWKYRISEGVQKNLILLSPTGLQFTSRLQAFLHAVKSSEFDEQTKSVLRESLRLDGWESNIHLPEGWITKFSPDSSKRLQFISKEGFLLKSYTQAIEFMKSFGTFNERDMCGIKAYYESKQATNPVQTVPSKALIDAADWKTSNLLPSGWRFRENKRSQQYVSFTFLTREDQLCRNTKAALDIIGGGGQYTPEDLRNIKTFLANHSFKVVSSKFAWKSDRFLPEGWKTRISESAGAKQFFLCPCGTQPTSRKQGYEHMWETGCSREYINDMFKMLEVEGWMEDKLLPRGWKVNNERMEIMQEDGKVLSCKTASEMLRNNARYTEQEVKNFELFSAKYFSSRHEWKNDDTVPEGWMFRVSGDKNFFLCPCGIQFNSRRSGYSHILTTQCSGDRIDQMLQSLSHEGWLTND